MCRKYMWESKKDDIQYKIAFIIIFICLVLLLSHKFIQLNITMFNYSKKN